MRRINIKKYVRRGYRKLFLFMMPDWPAPSYDEDERLEPYFIFMITPPYSGSTAMAKIIDTSQKITTLHSSGEGEWLVPGMCQKDRWDPHKFIDYDSVKAVWLKKFQIKKRKNPDLVAVFDKTPASMMRLESLISNFTHYSLLANNRNPYANCASILYRKFSPDSLDAQQRKDLVRRLAKDWVERSKQIKALINKFEIPLVTYEAFCEKPLSLKEALNIPVEILNTINFDADVKVKDYSPQPIQNQNKKQINKLTSDDITVITNVLMGEQSLLDYFGYELF